MIWRAAILLWLIANATLAVAAPERYQLDGTASRIEFLFDVEGNTLTGRVPVARADVVVDFADPSRSQVAVVLDTSGVTSNIGLVTSTMKEASVLDVARFPQATFVSRRITGQGSAARIEGDLTLKGVTRPVVLEGAIYRARGSDPGDLSDLVLLFEGSLSRSAFGVSGYAALVSDRVGLRVLVAIVRE